MSAWRFEWVQDYQLRATESDINLSVHCDNVAVSVFADIGLIHRVLENLLQNAMRHTPAGGSIEIHVLENPEKVWLEVRDTGDGIASHEIPHIFDRYYRPASETPDSGHGLGLAIVKRIVELHRSQVAVHSEQRRGTTISFWFPLPA